MLGVYCLGSSLNLYWCCLLKTRLISILWSKIPFLFHLAAARANNWLHFSRLEPVTLIGGHDVRWLRVCLRIRASSAPSDARSAPQILAVYDYIYTAMIHLFFPQYKCKGANLGSSTCSREYRCFHGLRALLPGGV